MRIRRKFKGGGTKDNKGYLKTNKENFTPFKEIEGGDITMDGVDIPLIAIPMDGNGKPTGMKFMTPGKDYEFKGADSTIEVPIYKKGDKAKWIKEEIKRLQDLGHDRGQAIKEANSKYENSVYGGDMEFMQGAGEVGATGNDMFQWDRQLFSEKDMVDRLKSGEIRVPGMPTSLEQKTLPEALRIGPSDTALGPNQQDPTVDVNSEGFKFYEEEPYAGTLDYELPTNIKDGNTGFGSVEKDITNLTMPTEEELMAAEEQGDLADLNKFSDNIAKDTDIAPTEVGAPITEQQPFQFYNPNEGVDIATAANLFGQNVGKGGNAGTAVAAGAKVGLGLARNIVSGLGTGKANRFATDEINEKNRQYQIDKAPMQYSQEGGELTPAEIAEARAAVGVNYTDAVMGDLFEKVGPVKKPTSYDPNLGKYRGMDYFNKVNVDGNKIQLATGKKYPSNSESLGTYVDYLRKQNPGYDVDVQYKEEGGDVTPEAMSTGNFSTETGEGVQNVEVEVNEYLLQPDGNLTKVLGETHEKGGVKMELPEGTKIISDHLKLNKDAKTISKDFDLSLKSTDTYAKAIDKFYKKSGLQDLIDEEEQIAKTIKEQQIAAAEEGETATRNINLEFLSSKINELNEAKQPMLDAARLFFSKIYDTQEAAKPKAKQSQSFQEGGATDPNDAVNEAKFEEMFNTLRGVGYDGTDDVEEMQDWISTNKPDAVLNYFKNGPATYTSKGLTTIQTENPEVFEAAGVEIKQNPGEYTEEERTKIKDAYRAQGLETNDFLISQFQDGLKAYRSPLVPLETLKTTGTLGTEPWDDRLAPDILMSLPASLKDKISKGQPLTTEDEDVIAKASNGKKANSGVYLQPDQSLLPPQGMVPSTKIERTYGRMEAELFTPDAQLNELNRSVDAAMDQLKDLPSGQQEAAIVQLQANKQQQADRIVSTVAAQNKQVQQQEQSFNIRQGDREVDANAVDNLSFEQRSLGAMANTEDDFRRYYNEGQRRNVEKFKTIESLNLMNQMYENFDFTNNGVENTVGSSLTGEELFNSLRYAQATKKGDIPVKKKQNGGEARRQRRVTSSPEKTKDTKVTRLYRRKGSKVKSALNFQTPDSTGIA